MTVHNMGGDPLAKYELERIEKKYQCDEVWYFYEVGSYEGSGQMLVRRDNLYDIHDMGHCSCYGPTDRMNQFIGNSLEGIAKNTTREYYNQIFPLLHAAGYQPEPKSENL